MATGVDESPRQNEAGCHSVATQDARLPLAKTEWQPENAYNPLPDKESFNPVATVAIVATFPDIPPPRVSAHPNIAQTILATLTGTPMLREDLERAVNLAHGTAGPALVAATINTLLLSGAIGKVNGRLIVQEVRP